ncbi:DUF418 domain-containing protein [Microtetraspora fusca]|uniref:DUF418 domain-containing protein n=1 Tax=Microtetraspora fusca TaxID=1997 RepID=A0ABW6VHA9_MICFU
MSTLPQNPPISQVSSARRLAEVDMLRGFALFGILVVNIFYMASPYGTYGVPDPQFVGPIDTISRLVDDTFFTEKFYLFFSFLFGYSFITQMEAAERAGVSVVKRSLRRFGALFLLGAFHAIVLWRGDILTVYAVLGLILLAMRKVAPRTAVKAAIIVLTAFVVIYLLLAGFAWWAESVGRNTAVNVFDNPQEMIAGYRGGPLDVVKENLTLLPGMLSGLWFMQGGSALAMFLLGFAAGRERKLENLPDHWLTRAQWVGFTIGGLGSLAVALSHLAHGADSGVYVSLDLAVTTVAAPLLVAAYAATLLRVIRAHPAVGRALAPAGRISATNYVGQSLVTALLFTGYGFALFGKVSPPLLIGIAAAIFAVQLAVSAWWTRNHRYGPAEWWLRSVTYGRTRRPATARG